MCRSAAPCPLPPAPQNTGFHVMCGLLIGVFVLLELGLNEVVMRLTEKVMASGVVIGQ